MSWRKLVGVGALLALAGSLLAATLAACGKYGPPQRRPAALEASPQEPSPEDDEQRRK